MAVYNLDDCSFLLMTCMIVVVTACTLTLTATMETSVSGVQLVEAVGVDEAVNLKVRVPRGIL